MKKLLLALTLLTGLSASAEGMSESELSTVITVAPFYTTTEAVVDLFTTNEYEEAGRIAADGVVSDEERSEMSVELQAALSTCLEDFSDFDYDELECLHLLEKSDG